MLRIILLTLLSVVILTLSGEMIYGLASCITEHGSHDTLAEYLSFSFDRPRTNTTMALLQHIDIVESGTNIEAWIYAYVEGQESPEEPTRIVVISTFDVGIDLTQEDGTIYIHTTAD